jgi:hypothetical protein
LTHKTDENLNYALAFVYIQIKQPAKAIPYATVLKQTNPDNPSYRQLFSVLGIK